MTASFEPMLYLEDTDDYWLSQSRAWRAGLARAEVGRELARKRRALHYAYAKHTKAELVAMAERAGGLRSSALRQYSKPALIQAIVEHFKFDRALIDLPEDLT